MHTMNDCKTYFTTAVSYDCKMFTKLTTGGGVKKLFPFLLPTKGPNKLEQLSQASFSSFVYYL
jgi:hypothetical protein